MLLQEIVVGDPVVCRLPFPSLLLLVSHEYEMVQQPVSEFWFGGHLVVSRGCPTESSFVSNP